MQRLEGGKGIAGWKHGGAIIGVLAALAVGATGCGPGANSDDADGFSSPLRRKPKKEVLPKLPLEPAPREPAPTEPVPTEPAPTEPAPTQPAPTQPAPTEPTPTPTPAPVVTVTYAPTSEEFLNPERGWMDYIDLISGSDFSGVRTRGRTIAWAGPRLDAFRTSPLSSAFLTSLSNGLARARAAGIKVVLRFSYNNGPYPNSEPDASRAQILEHINQLTPILRANADVISVLQAGFIGAWGEWHTSTNGLDNPTDRKVILEALLAALPPSRMTQVRYPKAKQEIYGAALADSEAFNESARARIGHLNDCFLASATDMGTYPTTGIETWKNFIAQEGRFTPTGGETCAVNPPRSDCPTALAEMERLRWSYLNIYYHPDVIRAWSTQGCSAEIGRRLGYRFELVDAGWNESARPGAAFDLRLRVRNRGWSSLHNPRPVFAVLESGTTRLQVRLPVDPRRWEGGSEASFTSRLQLPSGMPTGTYRLSLWMPDDAAGLRSRPEYSVRLANQGVWDATRGLNVLTTSFRVDANAPGTADASAPVFAP